MRVRGFEFPDDLHFLVEHDTWARHEPDGLVTVGLTSLGAHISGEFMDFIARPAGTRIERDRSVGALEMSKVIRSARSPVAGEIVAVNAAVRERPALINDDPYGEGWLVKLEAEDWMRDVATLVHGAGVHEAVERYMALLSDTFDEAMPEP
jgi:glycine cleavage system H lipoate-binding protein